MRKNGAGPPDDELDLDGSPAVRTATDRLSESRDVRSHRRGLLHQSATGEGHPLPGPIADDHVVVNAEAEHSRPLHELAREVHVLLGRRRSPEGWLCTRIR